MMINEENKMLRCSCIFRSIKRTHVGHQLKRTGKEMESDRMVTAPKNNKADIIWAAQCCRVETLRYWQMSVSLSFYFITLTSFKMSKISILLISSCSISQGISDIWLERKLNWPNEQPTGL